jgi:hypothetical protein
MEAVDLLSSLPAPHRIKYTAFSSGEYAICDWNHAFSLDDVASVAGPMALASACGFAPWHRPSPTCLRPGAGRVHTRAMPSGRVHHVRTLCRWFALASWVAAAPLCAEPLALFDAHLHYNADGAAQLPPAAAVDLLRRNGVRGALLNSTRPTTRRARFRAPPVRSRSFLSSDRTAARPIARPGFAIPRS